MTLAEAPEATLETEGQTPSREFDPEAGYDPNNSFDAMKEQNDANDIWKGRE